MKASIIISISEFHTMTQNFFKFLSEYKTISEFEIIILEDIDVELIPPSYFSSFFCFNIKKISTHKKVGYGKANNLGIKSATSEILIFMNDDIILTEGCLEILINDLIQSKADAVQPKLIYPQTNTIQSTGHVFTKYTNAHAYANVACHNIYANQSGPRKALTTALSATKKSLFLKMEMFDETYYNAWEGMEFFLKLTLNGYRCLYDSTAVAYHIRGGSRGIYNINENAQSAYFWGKWEGKIHDDLHLFYLQQLSLESQKHNYLVLNFSSLTEIFDILNKSKLKSKEAISYMHYSGLSKIDFFKILPIKFCFSSENIIYFCESFTQIINNKLWYEMRKDKKDIILDLNGNVLVL